MSSAHPTRCFTCGMAVGEPAQLNSLPDGKPCPACRDRLLESLPSIVPSRRRREVERHADRDGRDGRRSPNEAIESRAWLEIQDEGR